MDEDDRMIKDLKRGDRNGFSKDSIIDGDMIELVARLKL